MITETSLERIRNANDVVDIVGEYVTLKKSGHGFTGLCPFHNEKSPSFHVHPAKQIFHCFGCHKGGNVITFVMEVEGLTFPDAVSKLASRVGLEVEHEGGKKPFAPKAPSATEARQVQALDWAAKYFHYLLTEHKDYEFARDYLTKRGLSEKAVRKFRIGVSPRGWNTLLGLMIKRGFSVKELIQAGLVVEKDNTEGGYDRFRERIMFPIADKEGRTMGFGARLLKDEPNQPKYLNSTDSPLFSKRRTLYGIYENQRGVRLREEAVIVEGYMDVVGLYDKGVDNAVATMGTALTEEHCQLLRGLTKRVVTVFDPDAAGQEASRRSVPLFLAAGLFAKDLVLPEGKDPDEFALAHGSEAFYELCRTAQRQVTKLLKDIALKGALTEEETAKVLEDLTPVLRASRKLPDRVLLWDSISLVLKVSQQSLKELSESTLGTSPLTAKAKPVAPERPAYPSRYSQSRGPNALPKKPTLPPLEEEFFLACLRNPDLFLQTPTEKWLGVLKHPLLSSTLETLATQCKNAAELRFRVGELVHGFQEPSLVSVMTEISLTDAPAKTDAESYKQLLEKVEYKKKELEIQALSAQVKLNQSLGNAAEQLRLLERLKELRSSR